MSHAQKPGEDQGDKRGYKRKPIPYGLVFAWVWTILLGYHLLVVCDFGRYGPAALHPSNLPLLGALLLVPILSLVGPTLPIIIREWRQTASFAASFAARLLAATIVVIVAVEIAQVCRLPEPVRWPLENGLRYSLDASDPSWPASGLSAKPLKQPYTAGVPEPIERPSIGGKPAIQEIRGILDEIRLNQEGYRQKFGPVESEPQILERRYLALVSAALEGLSYEDAAKRAKEEGVDQLNWEYHNHLRLLKDEAEEIVAGDRAGYAEWAAAKEVPAQDRGVLLQMVGEVARQRKYAAKSSYLQKVPHLLGRGATQFFVHPMGLSDEERLFRYLMIQAKEQADPLIGLPSEAEDLPLFNRDVNQVVPSKP